jgi:hypothetical protein
MKGCTWIVPYKFDLFCTKKMRNMSYTDVHDILVYGFELSWFYFCYHYSTENRCNLDEATMKNNNCLQYNSFPEPYRTYSLSLSLWLGFRLCVKDLFYILINVLHFSWPFLFSWNCRDAVKPLFWRWGLLRSYMFWLNSTKRYIYFTHFLRQWVFFYIFF